MLLLIHAIVCGLISLIEDALSRNSILFKCCSIYYVDYEVISLFACWSLYVWIDSRSSRRRLLRIDYVNATVRRDYGYDPQFLLK